MSVQDDCYKEEQILAIAESLQQTILQQEQLLAEKERTIQLLRKQLWINTERVISQQKTIEELNASDLLQKSRAQEQERRYRWWKITAVMAVSIIAVMVLIILFF